MQMPETPKAARILAPFVPEIARDTTAAVETLAGDASSSSLGFGTTTIKYVREALATASVELLSLRRGLGCHPDPMST